MSLKDVFYGILIIGVLFFAYKAYEYVQDLSNANKRLHTELVGQKEAYAQLSERAAKLENRYVEQKKLREQLEKEFAEEKQALTGRIKLLSNATYLIRERARKTGKSDIVYQGKRLKYIVNEVRYKNGPPVGYVLVFDNGSVVSKLYNHRLDVKTAISRDENTGKYSVVSRADYVLLSPSINMNGEEVWTKRPFPLPINGGTATIDPTEKNQLAPRIHWWAPHINGGFSLGAGSGGAFLKPTLDVSLAGYGPTKNDLDWKFLHIGFDSDTELKSPGAHFIPVSYRFWSDVLSNTYLGPGVGWNPEGFNFQLNLNLTF